MHLNKAFFTFVFLLLTTGIYAQQAPMFSQNMFTYTAINPGSFAINDAICATGIIRQQWVGFTDADGNNVAPQTYLVSASAPVEFLKGSIGVNIIQDKLGFFKDVGAGLGYAYKVNFREGVLGIGAQINFLNRKIDFSKFKYTQGGDPILVNASETSDLMTDFSLGLFYNVANQYYVGISVANLMESKGNTYSESSSGAPYTDRIFYLIAGYEFLFPRNPMLKFSPSVLLKSDFAATQISISGLLTYNNKFWGGVTYNVQTADAFSILLGLNIKDLRIGYAYDLPLSSINSKGSHEIMVSYCFKLLLKKKKDSYRNTRFL
jgi:type IX secretion system PorP/SprF family membrane protein